MAFCKACAEPLVLEVDIDDAEEDQQETVPDDLELPCHCHFHWQCLLDQSSDIAISLKCPSCQFYLPSNQAGASITNPFLATAPASAILTRYVNEGGLQDDLDILPIITEEAYLDANPDARPARAYHLMCSEGDVSGIVELLQSASEDLGGDTEKLANLVRYQDPLADMRSGLHLAISNSQEEVVWLLLWLASPIPTDSFPLNVRQLAETMGIGRLEASHTNDVRALRNGGGQTAEDIALTMTDRWGAFIDAGLLRS